MQRVCVCLLHFKKNLSQISHKLYQVDSSKDSKLTSLDHLCNRKYNPLQLIVWPHRNLL